MIAKAEIIIGDCLSVLKSVPSKCVKTCITSPPYFGLRDYNHPGQIGMESTPAMFVARLVDVFREVRRVLADDGTLWLNLGDSYANTGKSGGGAQGERWSRAGGRTSDCSGTFRYAPAGFKPKDLMGIPWRAALALQDDGWYLRSDIIWHKPNPMPESVTDRPTKAHEYLFLLSKSENYFYDYRSILEPSIKPGKRVTINNRSDDSVVAKTTRNRRSVWSIPCHAFRGAHFATFPPALVDPCIRAGSALGDLVLDPFSGAGTTGLVALRNGRNYLGIEINSEYAKIASDRLTNDLGFLASVKTMEAK